jgi:myo-inositol-1-phosphate synthase
MQSTDRLGILTVGMGAVATTLYTGVEAARRGFTPGIGSLTQIGCLPLVAPPGTPSVPLRELLELAPLTNLVFGGWDLLEKNAYQAAARAAVLSPADLARHAKFLRAIPSFPGIADPRFTTRIEPTHVKPASSQRAQIAALRADIRTFRRTQRCQRIVVISCMSVEVYQSAQPVHRSLAAFEAGLDANDPAISPSQLYAYAALAEGVPFVNGTPNTTVDTPALQQFAKRQRLPIAGSDFKSGQTYLKTIVAAALRMRLLGLSGWFSTNILGNRDGLVLEDPQAFEAKKVSKTNVLADICSPAAHPALYSSIEHLVKINYFGPRGDNKEAWDSIDLFGWLGYPMQIKINFQCRDSILAAPLALDLVLLTDLAARRGETGVLEWLGFYFKTPAAGNRPSPGNDPTLQLRALETVLRRLAKRPRSSAGKKRPATLKPAAKNRAG